MGTAITILHYRTLLNDHASTDEQIAKRIEYLEAFCRNVIRIELEGYERASKHGKHERRP